MKWVYVWIQEIIFLKLLPSDGEKYKLFCGSSPKIITLRLCPIPMSSIKIRSPTTFWSGLVRLYFHQEIAFLPSKLDNYNSKNPLGNLNAQSPMKMLFWHALTASVPTRIVKLAGASWYELSLYLLSLITSKTKWWQIRISFMMWYLMAIRKTYWQILTVRGLLSKYCYTFV